MTRRQYSEDDIVQMTDEWWMSVEKFRAHGYFCWNKHKIFDANNAWITEL